jgi:hypothetical protein
LDEDLEISDSKTYKNKIEKRNEIENEEKIEKLIFILLKYDAILGYFDFSES